MGIGTCIGKCDRLNIPKLPRVKAGSRYKFYNYCSTCTRWWSKLKFKNPKTCPCCKCKLRLNTRTGYPRRSKSGMTPRM